MVKHKAKNNEGPGLLIEVSHMTRQIILKRKRLLREGGHRSLAALTFRGGKSWLAGAMKAPNANPWDAAHEMANRLKSEFGEQVYVEPDGKPGRYHELMSSDSGGTVSGSNLHPGSMDFGMGNSHASNFPLSHIGISNSGRSVGAGPQPPNPNDFLPRHSHGIGASVDPRGVNPDTASRAPSTTFPTLATVAGWNDLPEMTRAMMEVEAAQLSQSGFHHVAGIEVVDDVSRLLMLARQPNLSKALKRFLNSERAQLVA